MSVVVRLILTSFYFSVYSFHFFFHFSFPRLFYEKIILVFNKFIKNTAKVLIFILEKVSLK